MSSEAHILRSMVSTHLCFLFGMPKERAMHAAETERMLRITPRPDLVQIAVRHLRPDEPARTVAYMAVVELADIVRARMWPVAVRSAEQMLTVDPDIEFPAVTEEP